MHNSTLLPALDGSMVPADTQLEPLTFWCVSIIISFFLSMFFRYQVFLILSSRVQINQLPADHKLDDAKLSDWRAVLDPLIA